MAKTKYDPLEAAKIGADGEKAKDPPAFKNPDLDLSDVEATPPATPRAKLAHKPHPKFRVTAPGRVSVSGQICDMKKGDVIDSAGYGGEAGVEKLVNQGLKLELIQD